jgi:adenosylhomocysteine nucleosidase
LLVGLEAEARIARRLGKVAIGGGTAEGAVRAAAQLADAGVDALLSFGLAGGLDPALRPGALVIPRAVLTNGEQLAADQGLLQAWHGPTAALLLASETIIASRGDKQAAFAATGAQAVDMESGALARAARRAGLPWAVLRVICDPAERDLPPAALAALSVSGAIAGWRIARSILANPAQIPALIRLGGDAAQARRALQTPERDGSCSRGPL